MAKLIYDAVTSLDGYVADEAGNFDWTAPDEEVLAFINDRERRIGTYLFGRKMYETMADWETPESIPNKTRGMLDFAGIWQGADKVIYSKTLDTLHMARARLEREFDPDVIRKLKARSTSGSCRGWSHSGRAGNSGRAGR